MDNIWDRRFFEVRDHWLLWRGYKKTNDHAEPTVECKKKKVLYM